jgi:hypothetical protein
MVSNPPTANVLQLAGATGLAIADGGATASWGGSSANSANVTLNHNLGRIPVAVLATTQGLSDASGPGWCSAVAAAPTTSQAFIAVKADHVPTLGVTAPLYWIAIG